jgi:hypothetical protein
MDRDQHSQRRVQLSLSLRDRMHFTKGLRCRNSAEAACSTEVLALAGGRSRAPLPPSPRKPYSVRQRQLFEEAQRAKLGEMRARIALQSLIQALATRVLRPSEKHARRTKTPKRRPSLASARAAQDIERKRCLRQRAKEVSSFQLPATAYPMVKCPPSECFQSLDPSRGVLRVMPHSDRDEPWLCHEHDRERESSDD